VSIAGLLAVGVAAGPSIAAEVLHPHDEDAYQAYVTTYVAGWGSSADPEGPARDQAWVAAHPDQVLAAGEAACDWLAALPEAPQVDPSGAHDSGTLSQRYVGVDVSMGPPGTGPANEIGLSGLSTMGRYTVVAGAWSYLCWSTGESRTAPRSLEDD